MTRLAVTIDQPATVAQEAVVLPSCIIYVPLLVIAPLHPPYLSPASVPVRAEVRAADNNR